MVRFALLMVLSAPSFGAVTNFLCTNRDNFNGPVQFRMTSRTASLSWNKNTCSLKPIKYNPISSKYEGWIRFGSIGNDKACLKFGTALLGSPTNKTDFYWISVSKELQAGQDGFAQFGFQNTADPGAGPEAKLFVRCRSVN